MRTLAAAVVCSALLSTTIFPWTDYLFQRGTWPVAPIECMNHPRVLVAGVGVDPVNWLEATSQVESWASRAESRVVCLCNVHSVVSARQDPEFGDVLVKADLVAPDGGPVAAMIRVLTGKAQSRVNGPDLMWKCCEVAAARQIPIYLYGGSEPTLEKLSERLVRTFPSLLIAGAASPPYRKLSEAEDVAIVSAINRSGAGIVWVGLGCPKQEIWMEQHRGRVNSVMIGVGAAFDYHAGTIRRAPVWMQDNSLEWLFRLMTEPRRLWRRYLFTNSIFIWRATIQICGHLIRRLSNLGPK
jgi:N-acetylglucosaminyldiphosphoundecaprenol N-acetyl-beta-D-mannosaminyltransferase